MALVIQLAELNRNQNAYHKEQGFSDRVSKIVANLIGGDHFHSQFTKYGLHERRAIGITLGRTRWAQIAVPSREGLSLDHATGLIEIVNSKSYGTD
jgi:hypothetical protein